MAHFVYIAKCADGTLYCGYTTDPTRRISEHNTTNKGAKYTKGRRPVKLMYCETYPSKALAQKREYEVKQLSHADKVKLCSLNSSTILNVCLNHLEHGS